MKTLRVGIVGGAGQVGSALLKTLLADGRLTALGICRNSVSAARLASQGMPVRITQTDNPGQLAEATRDLDVLVNCALPRYQPSKTSAANQILAKSLGVACAGKHLVHLSSVAVYGNFISGRKFLFDNPRPDTDYGQQKLQMECLLRVLAKKHSMKCTILRVGHVYGPALSWSETFFDLINKDGFRLPFDGQLASNAVGISNAIAGIREVLNSEPMHATFNLTDIPQTSWRDIFDLHSQASGASRVVHLDPYESEELFREGKRWAETGMVRRVVRETWRWARHLPASYISSAPTLKTIMQRAVARVGSEKVEGRLWAVYCKRFAPRMEAYSTPEIPPIFWSEPVPGPCLSYKCSSPAEGLAGLRVWHDAISTPRTITQMSIQ